MGYDLARFVSKIDEGFVCSICSMVMANPVQSPCEHTFCSECIKEWLRVNGSCPIDRTILIFVDLKPTPRYFRNMMDKMEIRCDFEPKGCQTILSLELLQGHVTNCTFHPNFQVICNKGCNMMMARSDYENHNCFLRQQDEIAKLQREICRQQDEIVKLKQDKSNILTVPHWPINVNMQISARQTNVFEISGNSSRALAQLANRLTSERSFFQILILDISAFDVIEIALAGSKYITDFGTILDNRTIGYNSDGKVLTERGTTPQDANNQMSNYWEKGDIIKCGIQFPNSNDMFKSTEVSFYKNQKFVAKKDVWPSIVADLFPTIDIFTSRNSTVAQGPRVLYLSN